MSSGAIIAILDVVFVIVLGLGFLEGFLRGVKRSSLELGLTVAGIIIVALITPVVTNAVLNISVANGMTLQEMIIDALKSNEDIASLLNSSKTTLELINKVPTLLIASGMFLSMNLAMRSIVYGAYKLISLCFKSRKKEKELGLKRNRWAGGLISTVKMFAFVLIIFMPMTSLVKLADQIIPEPATAEASAAVEDGDSEASGESESDGGFLSSLPPIVKNVVHGINKSAFGVINSVGNVDDMMLDGVAKIEINGEKISLRSEISNYYNFYTNLSTILNAEDLSKVNWDAMDKAYEQVTTSPLYNDVVLDIVGEVISNNYSTIVKIIPSLKDYENILKSVSEAIKSGSVEVDFNFAEYFKPDIDKVYYTISGAGHAGYLAEVAGKESLLDSITILEEKYDELLTNAIDNIFDINIVKDSISPALNLALDKISTDPDLAAIFDDAKTEISDFASLKTQVKKAIVSVGKINGSLKAQNVAIGDITSDFMSILKIKSETATILSELGSMLDAIDGLEFMQSKTDGEKLLPKVLNKYNIGDLKDIKIEAGEKDETITTYKAAFEFIAPSIEKTRFADLYEDLTAETINFNSILKKFATKLVSEKTETTYSTLMSDVLLPLYRVPALKEYVFTPLINGSKDTGVVDFSLLEVEGNWAASYANWASDLPHITIVITELESKEYAEDQTMLDHMLTEKSDMNDVVKKLDGETIDKVMPSILAAKSLQPLRDQLAGVVVESINGLTGDTAATMELKPESFTGEDSQTSEFNAILKKFIEIYNSKAGIGAIGDIDTALLGQLLDLMKVNAYRVELSTGTESVKTNAGVTKSLFDALILKLESQYDIELTTTFGASNVYKIDFVKLMEFISKVSDKDDAFAVAFKNLAISQSYTEESVNALITATNAAEDIANVKNILSLAEELGLKISISDNMQKTCFEAKIDAINDDDIKAQFNNLIGVTA